MMQNATSQIDMYQNQIKNVLSQLRSEYEDFEVISNQENNTSLSTNELRKLSEISKRLNDYCKDIIAYQERTRLLGK